MFRKPICLKVAENKPKVDLTIGKSITSKPQTSLISETTSEPFLEVTNGHTETLTPSTCVKPIVFIVSNKKPNEKLSSLNKMNKKWEINRKDALKRRAELSHKKKCNKEKPNKDFEPKKLCGITCCNDFTKTPTIAKDQKCPIPIEDAWHPVEYVRNYLFLENHRLYCHGLFKKGRPIPRTILTRVPNEYCRKKNAYDFLSREITQEEVDKYKEWIKRHEERNKNYAISNIDICPFIDEKNKRRKEREKSKDFVKPRTLLRVQTNLCK